MKVTLIHVFLASIFVLCGNHFTKAIRYSRQMLYCE